MSTREIPLFIDGPDGPLEALHLDTPDAIGVALICHPHPLFAGTMQNKVVATLQRIARDAGYATLRFNFRGVGQSAGSYADGRGEIDDALAAARWLGERHPGLPLTLMGFSFGSCVAGNAAARLEGQGVALRHLFMLAPPVERFAVELPRQCPITVVQPEDDEVVTPARVYAWSESLALPHELLRVPGCSHFFHGKLIELKDLLQPRLAPAGAAG
ncbi:MULTISPECIES: alpha/beta hydrolase [unclassified Pseudomonas]|uniref:alpha/beta hydrolase n=1 Tax=unclassified Pseudomonas TaxID=196821 RepID=UPI0002A34642|nr:MULTISPECIES: alpha/beta hydrolase [unclassified Pseudomonas]MBB1607852.1 alpha/beta hydrolase [Pseudomonas sp. UMC76]MBB1638868.1 alpha/beta hydrolase [Pseudomonas sp. UME83]NTX87474.1 alpha/beta hydrolase [Pseudomonas sp. UMA643]NTY19058.1 alpha/beta hydrolase [Pseudomonas sp. UMC3103]NTY25190.1 alpha/beta hydrolase [Pseudomonas sp. UMA603]